MAQTVELAPKELLEETLRAVAACAQYEPVARMRAALALNTLEALGKDSVDRDCRMILHRVINGISKHDHH